MFDVILLVCATSVFGGDCNSETARIVMKGPDAPNEIACAMQSQAYFASTDLQIGEDEYLKIRCQRTGRAGVQGAERSPTEPQGLQQAQPTTAGQANGS